MPCSSQITWGRELWIVSRPWTQVSRRCLRGEPKQAQCAPFDAYLPELGADLVTVDRKLVNVGGRVRAGMRYATTGVQERSGLGQVWNTARRRPGNRFPSDTRDQREMHWRPMLTRTGRPCGMEERCHERCAARCRGADDHPDHQMGPMAHCKLPKATYCTCTISLMASEVVWGPQIQTVGSRRRDQLRLRSNDRR